MLDKGLRQPQQLKNLKIQKYKTPNISAAKNPKIAGFQTAMCLCVADWIYDLFGNHVPGMVFDLWIIGTSIGTRYYWIFGFWDYWIIGFGESQ